MDKQHILNEIVRTAASNDGKPLGRARFLDATGIKETDWSGVYWARWSDAVVEAGFKPNEMQGAYSDEYLLKCFAQVVRDIDSIPTAPELMLRSRLNKDFPSPKVFQRLGRKRELVMRLLKYSSERIEFDAIVPVCEKYLDANPEKTTTHEPSDKILQEGHVYLIKSGKYYKIGRTNSLSRRERELSIQLPEAAETVHTISTDDSVGIEAYWHRRFANRRLNGEWFDLSSADVKAFRRRKFM